MQRRRASFRYSRRVPLRFTDTTEDPDYRLSFSHIDTSDAFVLPQGTAASIGTRERWEAVTAANRARSRDDN